VNALLSFFYTLLAHDTASALSAAGLDPFVGYLHKDRPGRRSLALDLMEELRAPLADRFVLTLINTRQVSEKDFQQKENGAVVLKDEARKTVLSAWQSRKASQIVHPFLKEKIEGGLVPHMQAQLLARHLRGDLDGYPPFLWK
jgi:CRISPR-associated protein Cas1